MKVYISGCITWFVILKATEIFGRPIVKGKYEDVKESLKENEIDFGIICFIPILRLIVWLTELYLIVAPKEKIEEILKGGNKDEEV